MIFSVGMHQENNKHMYVVVGGDGEMQLDGIMHADADHFDHLVSQILTGVSHSATPWLDEQHAITRKAPPLLSSHQTRRHTQTRYTAMQTPPFVMPL
jgi:hypothetical protein